MPSMNTYALARPYPGGLSITDAIMIVGNRRRPVALEKAGDAIDLNQADVDTFTRSAYGGTIRQLFLSGVLMSVPQKLTSERELLFLEAFNRLNENGGNRSGIAGAPTVVQVEQGMHVGVMNLPDINNKLPDVPTPVGLETRSMELEPGIVAPGAGLVRTDIKGLDPGKGAPAMQQGGAQIEAGLTAPVVAPQAAAPQAVKKAGKKGRKDPAGEVPAPVPAAKGFEDWKNNLDFQTQKTRVAESTDQAFLAWVSKNDESRQLQKIADARLAELTKKDGG